MKITALLLIPAMLSAQTLTMIGPTSNIRVGTQFTLTLGVSGTTVVAPAPLPGVRQAIQFTINGTGSWPFTASLGVPQTGKSLDCGSVGTGINCVISGGISALVDGTLCWFTFTLPKTATVGTSAITVTNPLAAYTSTDTAGVATVTGSPVVTPGPFTLSVINPCASMTLLTERSQVKGQTACTTGDLNSDAKCDILDLQILETYIASGTCLAK